MGKNYVESSLKHYLKQKVRITLGVVVTFLITGMAVFAEGTTEKPVEEMNDFEKAEYYLDGLGKSNIKAGEYKDSTGKYTITVAENGDIGFSGFDTTGDGKEDTISNISNNMISKVTKELLENGALSEELSVIDLGTNGKDKSPKTNTGILTGKAGQETSGVNGTFINKGIIMADSFGQYIWGGKLYNHGIIISGAGVESGAQRILSGKKNIIENTGLIISTNKNGSAQYVGSDAKETQVYNYGYVYSEGSGQSLAKGDYNTAFNYGVINSKNGNGQEIFIKNNWVVTNSEIRNYGLITAENADKFAQSVTGETNSAYNFGIITGKNNSLVEVKDNAKAYNDGVIINETGTGIFSNEASNKENVVNNSILVINGDNITDNFTNNGVILNSKYEVIDKDGINKNVTEFKNGDTITNSSETGKTSGFIKNGSTTITGNLTDKNLNAVITDDFSNKAVFTYKNDKNESLNLINTTVTGYFKNKGILLDIQSGEKFTIAGDTVITALKDKGLTGEDVTAVKLSNGAILDIVGNAQIVGSVVGEEAGIGLTAGNGGKDDEGKKIAKEEADRQVKTILISNADESLVSNGVVKAEDNYTNIKFTNTETEDFKINFGITAEGETNKIVLGENVVIKNGIDGKDITAGNDLELEISEIENIGGNITLGASDDNVTINSNNIYDKTINLGEGTDSLSLERAKAEETVYKKEAGNTFDYDLMNTEELNLGGGNWYIGKGKLGFDNSSKTNNQTSLNVTKGKLYVEMNNNTGKVTTDLDNIVDKGTDFTVSATEGIKYILGKDFSVSIGDKFVIDTNYKLGDYKTENETGKTEVYGASIFNTEVDKNGDIVLSVKEASEVKNSNRETLANYKGIYDAMVGYISKDDNLRDIVNYSSADALVNEVKKVDDTASAFYTTGYAVTKDVTDTYMSVVEDFGRKAGKGEWIAYGKYVNSDTEFDGGKSSKGYDGDITGTVGMVEYGVNDTTSYGAVFGKGDTEVDIQGGGKLDGDNTYAGVYMKHRTQTGIDLTANVGYTKSDLDLDLATSASIYNMITSGSSDSDALTFALKGTKDYKVSDSVRLQPVVSARYSLINQDAVESRDANFRIDEQDVTIFEGAFGGNIIKDFNISNGTLSLMAGAEFVLTEVSKSDDGRYTLYEKEITLLDEEDIADNRIEGHIGAEYIHENGIGIDAKYEMIWTDKGDTDRIESVNNFVYLSSLDY